MCSADARALDGMTENLSCVYCKQAGLHRLKAGLVMRGSIGVRCALPDDARRGQDQATREIRVHMHARSSSNDDGRVHRCTRPSNEAVAAAL
ncbi:hypothetical protein [Xanthomonas hydrangeae]|uniref:hypothetical protein n=1 Tax=Xanthomonas hydrangeae TaxID=2775159 RepID=UPI0035166473